MARRFKGLRTSDQPRYKKSFARCAQASLIALESLSEGSALGAEVHQAHTKAVALSPLIGRFTDHLSFDLEFGDEQLTEERWAWLCGQRVRGLALQQQGLARLALAAQLPASPFRHLASLTVSASDGSQLSGEYPTGPGALFLNEFWALAALCLGCTRGTAVVASAGLVCCSRAYSTCMEV